MLPAVQRDRQFWLDVLAHPDVAPALVGNTVEGILTVIENPGVLPLATENGGLVFIGRCNLGRVVELHSLYKPEGWGREVLFAAKACFARVFGSGAEIVFTHEQVGKWRTRPPKSFGFRPEGEASESPIGSIRLWVLSKSAWLASPAYARFTKHEVH